MTDRYHSYNLQRLAKRSWICRSATHHRSDRQSNALASFVRRSSHRETDNLSSSPDNDRCEAVDLSGLSFVERQEKWLQRRQLSLRAKAQEVEKAAKDAASFNPNLAISQSSLKPAQVRTKM